MANQNPSQSNNFFKIGFFVFFGLFLIVLGAGATWVFINYQAGEKSDSTTTPTPTIQAPTTIPSPEPTNSVPSVQNKSDLEQIREAIAAKYSKPVNDTTVTINENNGTLASGGVKFAGEIAGAWLLAAKVNDSWIIVQDGNGTVSCELIDPYNFPTSMVPECIDSNGNPITR